MWNRRNLLQSISGLAAATAVPTAWSRSGLDLGNRQDRLTALAKMRGSSNGSLTIGFIIGTRYAVVESRAIPMFGILAGTFSRYRRRDEETFEARSLEVAFFTDLDTGALLTEWTNPVTGALVEIPQTRMGPSTILMTADGLTVPQPDGEAKGMEIQHSFRAPVINGNDVWITEEIRVHGAARKPGGQAFNYNEMSTYHALMSDLENPALASVPTQVDFHSLVSFRPWMGFGSTPGHTTARGAGTRTSSQAELPAAYQALTAEHHPDVWQDPLAVLESEADDA